MFVKCACGKWVSTNALGKRAHRRGRYHKLMLSGQVAEAQKLLK